ncbi:SCO family protein [Aestuariibaculum marinum]|uniref:SCO family protein n=1 Tax=Aestuariibaculum marinum TaxID=2683592 RepID=A0A8J6Q1F6_9FLAO|nr:SCO family protein [Aestuariibaculum marinum]MBD0822858.1 SCO family protein [Aestuariibaculum marinum]
MKPLKLNIILVLLALTFSACNSKKNNQETVLYQCPMHCESDKTYTDAGHCPICKMDLQSLEPSTSKTENTHSIPEESIFNLTSDWNTEEGEQIQLRDLKGKTLVMVMIYTSCKAACPRLVADMHNIEAKIPDDKMDQLNFALISIDPETDTPERLKAFAIENYMDEPQWTFLQGTESGVREFANVLAVKYKQISPIDFSHSNIISVFNSQGELIHQQEGLGVDNKETVASILKQLK